VGESEGEGGEKGRVGDSRWKRGDGGPGKEGGSREEHRGVKNRESGEVKGQEVGVRYRCQMQSAEGDGRDRVNKAFVSGRGPQVRPPFSKLR